MNFEAHFCNMHKPDWTNNIRLFRRLSFVHYLLGEGRIHMATSEPSQSLSLVFVRLFVAWLVGGALYFFTGVFTIYDGLNTFVSGIIGGVFVSAVGVAVCAILGLLLRIPRLSRFWCASYFPVASVTLFGFVLFVFSFVPGQLKDLGSADDGSPIKELGITWPAGYLLLLFAVVSFPLPVRPASIAVA